MLKYKLINFYVDSKEVILFCSSFVFVMDVYFKYNFTINASYKQSIKKTSKTPNLILTSYDCNVL